LFTKIGSVDTSETRTIIIFTSDDTSAIAFDCAKNNGYVCQYKYWLRPNITDHKGIAFAPVIVPILICTIAKQIDFPSSYSAQNMLIWPKQTSFITDEFGVPICATEKPWQLMWQLIRPFYNTNLTVC
jgi:hypothetical protein